MPRSRYASHSQSASSGMSRSAGDRASKRCANPSVVVGLDSQPFRRRAGA